jgi:hypothetical protein
MWVVKERKGRFAQRYRAVQNGSRTWYNEREAWRFGDADEASGRVESRHWCTLVG